MEKQIEFPIPSKCIECICSMTLSELPAIECRYLSRVLKKGECTKTPERLRKECTVNKIVFHYEE